MKTKSKTLTPELLRKLDAYSRAAESITACKPHEQGWESRSAKWTGDLPPKPRFWMHQLGGVSEDKYLDPDVFAAQANAALKAK